MSLRSRASAAWEKARGQVVVTRTAHATSIAVFSKNVIREAGAHTDIVIGPDGQMVVWTEPAASTDDADLEAEDTGGTEA